MIYLHPGAVGVFLKSVRVEGSDRIALLELRTGRPATGTPITSIALGDSTVPLSDRNANYLDEVEPLIFQVVGVQFEPLVEDEFDHAG